MTRIQLLERELQWLNQALQLLQDPDNKKEWVCPMLARNNSLFRALWYSTNTTSERLLPTLSSYKDKKQARVCWFTSHNTRVNAVRNAIKDINKQLSNPSIRLITNTPNN